MLSIKKLYKIGNGPSSSHTMGPCNATKYVMKTYPNADYFKVTLFGSLALTGKGHLTDKIIDDTFGDIKHEIKFDFLSSVSHPNTMKFEAFKDDALLGEINIVSIGGGLISVNGVDCDEGKDVYPHRHFKEIKKYCKDNNISLVDYIFKYEDKDIYDYMEKIYKVMMEEIEIGLNTKGVLPGRLKVARKAHDIYFKKIENETDVRKEKRLISAYAFAASEVNASGGVVVTAPTCGSCGILPSLVKYYSDKGYEHSVIIDGLLVAGLIGLIVKHNASISGAECGCQAEIGTATSMGAAFVSYIHDKDIDLIERAAEIAMEHSLGLTCDPIEGYVQIPCIERNAVGALRAIEASALTDFIGRTNSKISFDYVVETMYETGKDLNRNYRETSKGGLAKKYVEGD